MLNKKLKWIEELIIPEDFEETLLDIKKDDTHQKAFITKIYTAEDNSILKDDDMVIMLFPCINIKHKDLVMVEVSDDSPFETHLYQAYIYEDQYELRPLSTYLDRKTLHGKLEDISKEPIVAKAAKIIRNVQ